MELAQRGGINIVVSIGISNESITATSRNAPINENLLLDDQPAMMIESVPMAPVAMIYNAPTFKSTPRILGASGTTAHKTKTDIIERMGARLNTTLSAPSGVISSL